MSNLYKKHNYLNKDILTLRTTIREYDMSEAGFSLIKEYSLLPDDLIEHLESDFSKSERTKEIGKLMINDKDLSADLMKSFVKARKGFFLANEIQDEDVLAIKKDAIFIIEKRCEYLEFGDYIVFKPKNRYSSYLNLANKEFYYSIWKDELHTKGFGDIQSPMFDDIKHIMKMNETVKDRNKFYKIVQEYRRDYLSRELEVETYRELNHQNQFKLTCEADTFAIYADFFDEENDYMLDITYNYLTYIIPLINILI